MYIATDSSSLWHLLCIDLRIVYRDKVSKSNDWRWIFDRSDRDGKHLIVQTVVVHITHREMEAISNQMIVSLKHS